MNNNLHYDEKRREMVETQIINRGITQPDIINSMLEVPRHDFVPKELQPFAYEDNPLPIGDNQTISQPYIVALMIHALAATSSDKVLEIGTGSGYAAAVLSRLVNEVYTIERLDTLARSAQRVIKKLGYDNIKIKVGDGTKGWPEASPFDCILVSAGAPVVPETLSNQLVPGGRMVIPVGDNFSQDLMKIEKRLDGHLICTYITAVRFVPLIGEEGW